MTLQQAFELAISLHQAGDLAGAESLYVQIVNQQANHVGALCGLAEVIYRLGRNAQALEFMAKAVASMPGEPALHMTRGIMLVHEGQFEEAIAAYQQALAVRPDVAEAYSRLATPLLAMGRAGEAIEACQSSLALRPGHGPTIGILCSALSGVGDMDEVIALCKRALQGHPEDRTLYVNLGWALREQGRLDEAIECYRSALATTPHRQIHDDLLFTLHFHPGYGRQQLFQEHLNWAQLYADPLRSTLRPFDNNRSPDRKLRIGYVAHDLGNNPVGRFLAPLLENHDRAAFEVYLYCDRRRADPVGEKLAAAVDAWRPTGALTDDRLSSLVREDRIDLLVDLVMHSNGSRLLAFARKPAPIQVTYLAYCSTTGLDTIDYRLTDRYLDPPEIDPDASYSEKSVRLPNCFWCYPPPPEAPRVAPLPASTARYVTFGCLNEFSKVTPAVLATWCGLLAQVPQAKLILHAKAGSQRARALQFFADNGIDAGRVDFIERLALADYFAQYNRIDIALDPFPFAGGTTTFDALWMGVPVVTLAGQTAVGRGAVSILWNLGLEEWVSQTTQGYIRAAAGLASDIDRLQLLRQTLRQRLQASPLTDAPRFARDIESAFRQMWRRWCQPG